MSRTWKDRPVRVQLQENMRKGRIDHDHRPARSYEGWSRLPDRELSGTFDKSETSAINDYIAFLDSRDDLRYEIEESKNVLNWTLLQTEGRVEYSLKTVKFLVYKKYVYSDQELCTDFEHYDFRRRVDTRNEKIARCTPRWDHTIKAGDYGLRKNRVERTTVKAELKEAQRLANSGSLDVYYSNEKVEEQYASKEWSWED